MQTWLYFGLIAECTGRPVDVTRFIRAPAADGDAGAEVVATDRLFSCIDEWVYSLRELSLVSLEWEAAVSHTRDVLFCAIEASGGFDYVSGMEEPRYAALCSPMIFPL